MTLNPYAAPKAHDLGDDDPSDPLASGTLQALLDAGEQVLWRGRPAFPWRRLPFLGVISAIVSVAAAATTGDSRIILPLFVACVIPSSAALAISAEIRRRRTRYILTDRKAIVCTRRLGGWKVEVLMPEEIAWSTKSGLLTYIRGLLHARATEGTVTIRPPLFRDAPRGAAVTELACRTLFIHLGSRLSNTDGAVRRQSIGCLLRIGTAAAAFETQLLAALSDDDACVRELAVTCFERIGCKQRPRCCNKR